jgi:hypothetical protein
MNNAHLASFFGETAKRRLGAMRGVGVLRHLDWALKPKLADRTFHWFNTSAML